MGTTAIVTVSEIGREIAQDIETQGHWQSGVAGSSAFGVCVVTAPSCPRTYGFDSDADLFNEFMIALLEKLNLPVRPDTDDTDTEGTPVISCEPVTRWNDRTPTPIVLDVLRSL